MGDLATTYDQSLNLTQRRCGKLDKDMLSPYISYLKSIKLNYSLKFGMYS